MTTPYEEGNPNAPILFLCEAPASVEMRMGKPMAGPSGDIFNDCLHSAGLIRQNAYILNVWPFRVFKEKDDFFMSDRPTVKLWDKKSGFTEEGMKQAGPTIERVNRAGANVIVTMGVPALALAMGKRPVMKWRGSPLWSERFDRKVIPTIHPAATMWGTYLWRYLIVADMEKARDEMDSPDLELPERRQLIDPTFDDVMDYIKLCATKPRLASDLEVINHQVSCFCLVHQHEEGMCVPMGDEYGNAWWNEEQEMAIWQGYARLMADPEIMKINQNLLGFDIPFLIQQNNIFTYGEIGDPMIAQSIMYPEFNKGLDFITSIYTREPYYKEEGKMWRGVGGDIKQFWRYNNKDGMVAMESWDKLAEEMTEKDYWPTYNRTIRLGRTLNYMGLRGFAVDLVKLEQTKTEVKHNIRIREEELKDIAKYSINVSSPKQVQQYFYGLLGITPYHNKTGGVTTDDKAMARIYRRYNLREAKLVQEIRGLKKLDGTYLEVTLDADNRLRCSWNPRGTMFGRVSSGKTIFGTGMNQQNLHPDFKQFLVADERPLI